MQSKQQLLAFQIFKSYLCVFFGDHEQGAALALKRGNRGVQDAHGLSVTMLDPFVRGMSLYAMARKTSRRKYRAEANKARFTLDKWVQRGNPNVVHQLKLLNAEKAALERGSGKTIKDVSALYHEAVALAARGGFLQDAGLASERHADYLLHCQPPSSTSENHRIQEESAIHYMKEAVKYYSDFGAHRKVEQPKLMYPPLV